MEGATVMTSAENHAITLPATYFVDYRACAAEAVEAFRFAKSVRESLHKEWAAKLPTGSQFRIIILHSFCLFGSGHSRQVY